MQSLKKITLKERVNVYLPKDVFDKIKYLCRKISKVEWSGILLYDIEGTIKDPENMRIILKDIIPMDRGSETYTEFEFNKNGIDKYIDYIEKNEQAMYWYQGLIHSHNSMAVFFSGTDMEELEENSNAHNFYLSMIVNNAMDMTAKIGFIASTDKVCYTALDENGKPYNPALNTADNKLFLIYDCDIIAEDNEILIDDIDFIKNVEDILKPKQQKLPLFTSGYSRPQYYDENDVDIDDDIMPDYNHFDYDYFNMNNRKNFNFKKNRK